MMNTQARPKAFKYKWQTRAPPIELNCLKQNQGLPTEKFKWSTTIGRLLRDQPTTTDHPLLPDRPILALTPDLPYDHLLPPPTTTTTNPIATTTTPTEADHRLPHHPSLAPRTVIVHKVPCEGESDSSIFCHLLTEMEEEVRLGSFSYHYTKALGQFERLVGEVDTLAFRP